jgi:hypothetical protein
LEQTSDVSMTVSSITPNNMNVYIGGITGTATSGWFHLNGLTDEVKIYNYALDAGEVCWLCNEAKPAGVTCNC